MKLYDRMMTHPQVIKRMNGSASQTTPDEHTALSAMKEAVVIDASNVAKYVAAHGYDESSVPSFLPPFSVAWWETSFTSVAHTEQHGALSVATELGTEYGDPPGWRVDWFFYAYGPVTKGMMPLMHHLAMYLRPDGSFPNDDVYGFVHHDGRLWAKSRWPPGWTESEVMESRDRIRESHVRKIHPFLMAIGFCHCRNVELIDGAMPPPKVQAKQEKKLGRSLIQFKEIVIDPRMTTKRLVDASRPTGPATETALHIVRGNFAHYTEDKPLFGKHSGTFWRPAHVRGAAAAGTVFKDYRVKA